LTQEQLAERAGIDLTFLQKIEASTSNLSVSMLIAVADALAVPPSRLLRRAAFSPPRRGRPRSS